MKKSGTHGINREIWDQLKFKARKFFPAINRKQAGMGDCHGDLTSVAHLVGMTMPAVREWRLKCDSKRPIHSKLGLAKALSALYGTTTRKQNFQRQQEVTSVAGAMAAVAEAKRNLKIARLTSKIKHLQKRLAKL